MEYSEFDIAKREVENTTLNANRPYNKEARRLKSLVNFGVISPRMAKLYLEEFKNREHATALIMNQGRN